jgi:hypothetical protein
MDAMSETVLEMQAIIDANKESSIDQGMLRRPFERESAIDGVLSSGDVQPLDLPVVGDEIRGPIQRRKPIGIEWAKPFYKEIAGKNDAALVYLNNLSPVVIRAEPQLRADHCATACRPRCGRPRSQAGHYHCASPQSPLTAVARVIVGGGRKDQNKVATALCLAKWRGARIA